MNEISKEEILAFYGIKEETTEMNVWKSITSAMEEYAAQFKDTASKGAVSDELIEKIVRDEFNKEFQLLVYSRHIEAGIRIYKAALQSNSKGAVWDYSDIAIKFKHWIPEKEFENENAAFTFFFEEVYNKVGKK